jgi:hypothetical protein
MRGKAVVGKAFPARKHADPAIIVGEKETEFILKQIQFACR